MKKIFVIFLLLFFLPSCSLIKEVDVKTQNPISIQEFFSNTQALEEEILGIDINLEDVLESDTTASDEELNELIDLLFDGSSEEPISY